MPSLIAGVAALAVVMIALGVAASTRDDPLRARLTQLGAMTAKDLSELELQQPFFDRTIKPLAARMSGAVARVTSASFTEQTEKRLAMAGNPGDMRVSRSRREALRDIVPRTEVQPLTNFIGAIIQAEQLGVAISKVLQVQSEQLRIERRQRAEEMAAKAPIKMLFPLVGCIFPSLFIVILGPAVILIVQNLGTK